MSEGRFYRLEFHIPQSKTPQRWASELFFAALRARFLSDRLFVGRRYWGKAWKSCWGQACSASVSLISPGRRSGPAGRQAAPGLRIILSDVLKTKRADLHISAPHWNDPERTQWTVSSGGDGGVRVRVRGDLLDDALRKQGNPPWNHMTGDTSFAYMT